MTTERIKELIGDAKVGFIRIREYLVLFQTLAIFDLWTRDQPYVPWWAIWVIGPVGSAFLYWADKKHIYRAEQKVIAEHNPILMEMKEKIDKIEAKLGIGDNDRSQ